MAKANCKIRIVGGATVITIPKEVLEESQFKIDDIVSVENAPDGWSVQIVPSESLSSSVGRPTRRDRGEVEAMDAFIAERPTMPISEAIREWRKYRAENYNKS